MSIRTKLWSKLIDSFIKAENSANIDYVLLNKIKNKLLMTNEFHSIGRSVGWSIKKLIITKKKEL